MQYHWVDATDSIVADGPERLWIDPATSWVWEIDIETGDYRSGWDTASWRFYENATCAGTGWVYSHPPRVPFRLDGLDSEYFVRGDTVTSTTIWAIAYVDPDYDVCVSISGSDRDNMVPELTLDATGLVEPPASPWVGPLRREL